MHAHARPRLPFLLAWASLFAASACGGDASSTGGTQVANTAVPSPVAPAESPSGAAATATPAPGSAADGIPDPVLGPGADFNAFDMPFQVPIEGPIENEESVDRGPTADFPISQPKGRPALKDLPADDPVLGHPLVINGRVIPREQVQRELCLGQLGMSEINDARTKIFIEEEKQRRLESGQSVEGTSVGMADVESTLKEIEENIKREYPNGGVGLKDVLDELASYDPKEKLRFQMEFGRLFLPDDPAQFPPVTQEAILKNQGGDQVIAHYKMAWEERKGSDAPTAKDPGEQQFDQAILQQVLGYLVETASITADPAPGVLYRVNGVDITQAEIWGRIKDRVRSVDVLAAKQWIANTTLLEEALKAAGAWLNDEDAYSAYHAHSDPYKDSVFSIERVALLVKAFPSIERYKLHRRIIDSFLRMRHPSEEELQKFADRHTDKIVGQVNLDVDLLLCSAYDFKNNQWIPNGWTEAENRMRDVLRLLVEEQRPWEELMERYSDFYERPLPMSQQGIVVDRPKKGHFHNVQRNGLLGLLAETEYNMFLSGTSITEFVFFEQEVGTYGQPIRGPFGWYLPRLFRRTKPPERVSMDEQTFKELVLDDYLQTELNRFAQELIKKNEVYGLDLYEG